MSDSSSTAETAKEERRGRKDKKIEAPPLVFPLRRLFLPPMSFLSNISFLASAEVFETRFAPILVRQHRRRRRPACVLQPPAACGKRRQRRRRHKHKRRRPAAARRRSHRGAGRADRAAAAGGAARQRAPCVGGCTDHHFIPTFAEGRSERSSTRTGAGRADFAAESLAEPLASEPPVSLGAQKRASAKKSSKQA